MRFLCLHGVGSNAAIFEAQLAVILKEFSEHEFHFLQGEIEVDPENVKDYFAGPYFSYFELCTPSQIHSAFQLLDEVIADEGSFDGVFAFSHGAALAASYMLYHAKNSSPSEQPFRSAVFFSASLPFDLESKPFSIDHNGICYYITPDAKVPCTVDVSATIPELMDPAYVHKWDQKTQFLERFGASHPISVPIAVPTAHIYALNDRYGCHAAQLQDFCVQLDREVLVHDGGHAIPYRPSKSAKMVECIRKVLNSAVLF
ncbi:Serine hydrolase FSH [Penicillium cf. griseofulvum]|nr:Serine hydrolase FSH [Penicillium cf. griseofulvum]